MNLIIVDDEILAVESMIQSIDWKTLGIKRVFSAFNILEAKQIIKNKHIDIILCDIEMPMGNGIELLEWLRLNKYVAEFMFLTCHENFKYAQKALQLGCVDYLLKPIEISRLMAILLKLIGKIRSRQKEHKYHEIGKNWEANREKIQGVFWKEVLLNDFDVDNDSLVRKGKKYNLNIEATDKYMIVLFSVKYRPITENQNERNIINFALDNLLEDIFLIDERIKIALSEDKVFIVIPENVQNISATIKEKCYEYIHRFYQFFDYKIVGYMSRFIELRKMSGAFYRLIEMDRNNASSELHIYSSNGEESIKGNYNPPNLVFWSTLFAGGKLKELKNEVDKYYQLSIQRKWATRKNLMCFIRDFDGMFYKVLGEKKGDYSKYNDKMNEELYQKRYDSWEDMIVYIERAFEIVIKGNHYIADKSVVESVKEYILKNIDKVNTREELARYVYLNQDYLSRIFKKEEKMSLKEYMIHEKMKIAKELLSVTDMPISEIGMRVGYFNFAHFSNSFKKHVGKTPRTYRREHNII